MKYLTIAAFIILLAGCRLKTPVEYTLDEKDLVPEGITYSVKNDAFYLTSIGKSKIIVVDRKSGMQKDFIKKREFGFTPGVGILADDERNLLYAIGGYYMKNDSLSSLYVFDLNAGRLLRRYDLKEPGHHFLNDLTLDKRGTIYLTDTKASSIYILTPGSDSLEMYYNSPEIEFPNGIALSEDNSKLFIASALKGIRILDISTKTIINEADSLGITQGIDGLDFYKNHLFAIQNGVRQNTYNFRKLILTQGQDAIAGHEIIDSNTTKLNVPLTFCIAGDKAVVIGNSNLQYLNQENYVFSDADSIPPTKLQVYRIK